ncbi:Gfo/Idh/MocA family protein [Amphibiibacter pelophylacis]|uniref:Gfo/Idh/MocA family oxidoreductase n=1 Tax=Amphibiibacter pelophylacis TaxID=1799477 RepID=A0ACC6P0D9_9BURK
MSAPAALNVALVGMGYAGQTFHAPLILAESGLRLTHVISSQPDTVRAVLAARGGPQGVHIAPDLAPALADPGVDLVVLASPNSAHAPQALAALAAGKHVVIDKPMALDAAQAQTLADAATASGRHLSVFHNRRWDDDFLAVQALLHSGLLGEVRHAALSFDRFRPQPRERWRESPAPGGGLWMDLGPHLIDQALRLFGAPQQIWARLDTLRPGGQGVDDAVAHLFYASGLRVTLQASMLTAQPRPRFALHGTHGSAHTLGLDGQEDALKAGHTPGQPVEGRPWGASGRTLNLALADASGQISTRTQALPCGDYGAYWRGLVAHLRGAGPAPVLREEVLAVMRLLDAGAASSESGRVQGTAGVQDTPR